MIGYLTRQTIQGQRGAFAVAGEIQRSNRGAYEAYAQVLQKKIETRKAVLTEKYLHAIVKTPWANVRGEMMEKAPVTIYDIAKQAGVSLTTVSRVLANQGYPVSEKTREVVLKTAIELGYLPKKRGAKKTVASPSVYVVVPSIVNPYYSQLATGVERALQKNPNVKMVLLNTNGTPEVEREFAQDIARNSENCLGAIVASIAPSHEHLLQLTYAGVPIVAFDQQIDLNCHMVRFHYRQGGHMAASHLIDRGKKSLGFISSPLTRFSRKEVYAGFQSALDQRNMIPNPKHIRIASEERASRDDMYDFLNGQTQMWQMIKEGALPQGIVCINDVTAVGVLESLQMAKIKVPQEVAVIGFDNTFLSQIVTPKLSTIEQSALKMGDLAADILLNDAQEERIIRITLEPSLVLREST